MQRYDRPWVTLGLLTWMLIGHGTISEAYEWNRHGPWSHPRVVVVLPHDATALRFGDGSYYYCRG